MNAAELFQVQSQTEIKLGANLRFLGGGGLFEVAGESGVGKTQFCIQLALEALNGHGSDHEDSLVIYLCTESQFPIQRLSQLLQDKPPQLMDRIMIRHVLPTESNGDDGENLLNVLEGDVLALLQHTKLRCKLLVLDSIAGSFRHMADFAALPKRAKSLQQIATILKFISFTYGVVVVCTNQVTSNQLDTVPALGLAWSNQVNTRIWLARDPYSATMRHVSVRFSSYLASGKLARYSIDGQKGLVFENNNDETSANDQNE